MSIAVSQMTKRADPTLLRLAFDLYIASDHLSSCRTREIEAKFFLWVRCASPPVPATSGEDLPRTRLSFSLCPQPRPSAHLPVLGNREITGNSGNEGEGEKPSGIPGGTAGRGGRAGGFAA